VRPSRGSGPISQRSRKESGEYECPSQHRSMGVALVSRTRRIDFTAPMFDDYPRRTA
jgi:hypothetical protein